MISPSMLGLNLFRKKIKKKIKTVLNGFMTNKKTKAVRDSFIGIVHESKQTK